MVRIYGLGKQVVVYQDSWFAIVYHCLDVLASGECALDRSYVEVLAREAQLTLEKEELYNALLLQTLPSLHLDPNDVERVLQKRDTDYTKTVVCNNIFKYFNFVVDCPPEIEIEDCPPTAIPAHTVVEIPKVKHA